jgi:hypothetical protein
MVELFSVLYICCSLLYKLQCLPMFVCETSLNNDCLTRLYATWVPVTRAWRVLGLRVERRPPAMEASCEYIDYAAAGGRQEVVLQLGGYACD